MLGFMGASDVGRARMTAALGNHRRIQIIRLLRKQPLQCVEEIAAACRIDESTASEHLRRLHEGGMIEKKYKGRRVLLSVTKRGTTMLRTIDMLWDASAV
jgi:DNA-binding transcriptional ArsR family regulator